MRLYRTKQLQSSGSLRSSFAFHCLLALIATPALLTMAAGAKTTTGDFISARTIQVPANFSFTYPGVAAGYLNGDKLIDFTVSGELYDPGTGNSTSAIYSLLNNVNGTFPPVTAVASHGQVVMALADLDGDGKPDLICTYSYADPVVARQNDIDVEISFGRGDGTFRGTEKYTLIGRVESLKVGDINGDGKPDLVVGTDGGFQILLNNGNGTFQAAPTLNSPDDFGFTLRDINGDGRADLLIPQTSSGLAVAFGTAAGGFTTPVTYATGPNPEVPAAADINGDGIMDIAVPSNHGVDLLLGNGDGTFRSGGAINSGPGVSVALADLRNDGKIDLIVTSDSINQLTQFSMHRISVYAGNGDGTFAPPTVYNEPEGPAILGVLDVAADHSSDVVLSDLTVLKNAGHGQLRAAPITLDRDAAGIATGDFNGDGKPDVAAVHIPECTGGQQCETTVNIFLGSGSTYFQPGKEYPTGITGAYLPVGMSIASGDLNGDGKLDLVLSGGDTQTLSILLGNGDGTLQGPKTMDLGSNASLEVFLADVNNDHVLDIVLDSGVMLGKGDGTFGALIPFPPFPNRGISRVGIADFNGDGKLDIAAGLDLTTGPYTSDTYAIAILLGDGTGHFTTASQWATNAFATQIVPARMNGDAFPDLAVAFGTDPGTVPPQGYGISIFLNNGDGTFPNQGQIQYSTNSRYIAVGDFNGDGVNDVAGSGDDQLVLLLGNGDGTLAGGTTSPFPRVYPAMTGPIVAGDFNLDGALDVLTANPIGVSRYINSKVAVQR